MFANHGQPGIPEPPAMRSGLVCVFCFVRFVAPFFVNHHYSQCLHQLHLVSAFACIPVFDFFCSTLFGRNVSGCGSVVSKKPKI